jgi:Methyltransferase FkbM domain
MRRDFPPSRAVGFAHRRLNLGDSNGQTGHQVSVCRFDDVLDDCQVDQVDLVKIDIEGSEYGALLGTNRLIATHRPTFLIELNEPALRKQGNSSEDVKRLFHEAGYQGWVVTRRGFTRLTRSGSHAYDECLFVPGRSAGVLSRIMRMRRADRGPHGVTGDEGSGGVCA